VPSGGGSGGGRPSLLRGCACGACTCGFGVRRGGGGVGAEMKGRKGHTDNDSLRNEYC